MSEEKTVSPRRSVKATEKPKTVRKTKTATTAEPKARAKAAEPKAEAKPKAAGKAKAAAETKPAAKTTAKAEPKTALKRTTKTQAEAKKPAVKAAPKAKTGLKPKAEPKAKVAAKPKKPPKATGAELAELVAAAAAEHQPIDPVLLDLSGRSSVADWFFVASADNPRQMEAIAEKIIRRARERGVRPLGQEGMGRGAGCPWVLVDLGDVVVHIFNLEARKMYDLEGLWTDAPRHPVEG